MTAVAAVLLSTVTGFAAAVELDDYVKAATAGMTGEIVGRVYEERRRPELPDRPLQDITITLLPRPEALTRRLDEVRRGARESHDAFRAAVPRMLEAQQEHERDVRTAGGADLVFTVATGSDGTFTITGAPAGAWILVARQDAIVPKAGPRFTKKDRETYRVGPALEAYRSVRLWVREIALTGGAVETVELTDRNVWFSGIVDARPPAGR